MVFRARSGWTVLFVVLSACGASGGAQTTSNDTYQEYTCPDPIGKIVREDCSRIALSYEGDNVEGSVGVGNLGASGSYKREAIREADQLVQVLKEQRVGLCNDFNTCKLTVAEYGAQKRGLDDSYVGLLAIRDRLKDVDAEGAVRLLEQVRAMSRGVQGGTATLPGGITLAALEGMIVAEAMMDYEPVFFHSFVEPVRISRTAFYRPRKSNQVAISGS